MELPLTLLHTAASHVAGFDALLAEIAPGAHVEHRVRADLLADARRLGATHDAVRDAVARAVREAAGEAGAQVVLCTCSTLGGIAEQAGRAHGLRVLRVDRPMAEQAVRLGRRVRVVAALASTLEPTVALIREAADSAGVDMDLQTSVCEAAWALFEAGRESDYLQAIADHARRIAADADVIVLAQASMAAAIASCEDAPPVLCSPRSGLQAALELAGYSLQGARTGRDRRD